MFFQYIKAAALAAMLVLAGCASGSSFLLVPVVDMTLVTGTGAPGDPYVMPTNVPAGTNGGLEDWFAAGPGSWTFSGIYGFIVDKGVATALQTLTYDTVNNQWVVLNDRQGTPVPRTLAYDGVNPHFGQTGWYLNEVAVDDATYLRVFDADPATSQYGTFAIWRDTYAGGGGTANSFMPGRVGLNTASADMPATGTADYNAQYEVVRTEGTDGLLVAVATGGAMLVRASFSASGGSIGTLSSTPASFLSGPGDVITVYVNGTISGAGFIGNSSGTWTTGGTNYYFGGLMDGEFYGPAAAEIAGGFNLDSLGAPTTTMVGGFWGAKQ